jgi:hypothetical protein
VRGAETETNRIGPFFEFRRLPCDLRDHRTI